MEMEIEIGAINPRRKIRAGTWWPCLKIMQMGRGGCLQRQG